MKTREAQESMEASNQEVWKPVTGYAGYYEVSSHGNVRSVDRVDSRGYRIKGRTLKPRTHKQGYRLVTLSRNGKVTSCYVHRLVLSAHVGPCPEGQEVRHLNGVPTDNRLSNLAYGTPSENNRDTLDHGRNRQAQKTHCPNNHPHFEGNGVRSLVKRGWRSCLICHRADSYIRRNNIPEADHWKIRDYYLERFLLEESENV